LHVSAISYDVADVLNSKQAYILSNRFVG